MVTEFIIRNPNAFEVTIRDLGMIIDASEPGIDLVKKADLEEILESANLKSLLSAGTLIRVISGSDVPFAEALESPLSFDSNIVTAINDAISPDGYNRFLTADDEIIIQDKSSGVISDGYTIESDGYGGWNLVVSSGGISESAHEDLDTLTHDLSEDSYEEFTRSGNKVTNITAWSDSGKTLKIRETNYIYNGHRISTETIKQYDGSGTLKYTLTGTYSYTGNRVENIDWNKT